MVLGCRDPYFIVIDGGDPYYGVLDVGRPYVIVLDGGDPYASVLDGGGPSSMKSISFERNLFKKRSQNYENVPLGAPYNSNIQREL